MLLDRSNRLLESLFNILELLPRLQHGIALAPALNVRKGGHTCAGIGAPVAVIARALTSNDTCIAIDEHGAVG